MNAKAGYAVRIGEDGRIYPLTFLQAPQAVRDANVNGCGPGGAKVDLVPDSLAGVDIETDCNIHDWMYNEGWPRELADGIFIANMTTTVRRHHGGAHDSVLLPVRLKGAWLFYLAVTAAGAKFHNAAARQTAG
jgi:hypothetical protein